MPGNHPVRVVFNFKKELTWLNVLKWGGKTPVSFWNVFGCSRYSMLAITVHLKHICHSAHFISCHSDGFCVDLLPWSVEMFQRKSKILYSEWIPRLWFPSPCIKGFFPPKHLVTVSKIDSNNLRIKIYCQKVDVSTDCLNLPRTLFLLSCPYPSESWEQLSGGDLIFILITTLWGREGWHLDPNYM